MWYLKATVHILRLTILYQCRWFKCIPSCAVWREGMLTYAKAHPDAGRRFRIPATILETLRYDLKNLRKHQYAKLSPRSYRRSGPETLCQLSPAAKILGLCLVFILLTSVSTSYMFNALSGSSFVSILLTFMSVAYMFTRLSHAQTSLPSR